MQNQNAVSIEPMEDGLSPLELRARAGYYQLLAGAFVEEPGCDYLAALRAPEALAELGLAFDADVTDIPLDQLQDVLACEYATLFTTSGGCWMPSVIRCRGWCARRSATCSSAISGRARCAS
jgi:hypothetical protein